MERKRFRFNQYCQPIVRDSFWTTYANKQLYVIFWVDVNGYGWSIYDESGGIVPGTAYNVNFGTAWGVSTGPGATSQFPEWSQIYGTYRVNKVHSRFTPNSFAATGSQSAITSFTDPTGVLAGLISRGVTLPAGTFQGALGDVKNLRMTMPFKQVQQSLNLKSLIAMEVPQSYIQTISEGLATSNFRQLYPSQTRYGRASGDPEVLRGVLPALITIMPVLFTDSFGPSKVLGVFQPFAEVEFMQRRTTIASYSSTNEKILRMRIEKDMALLRSFTNEQSEQEEEPQALVKKRVPNIEDYFLT